MGYDVLLMSNENDNIDIRVVNMVAACPNMYGRSFWPYSIVVLLEGLCLLFVVYEIIESFRAAHRRQRFKRITFCCLLALFLFIRILFYVVPMPWNNFNCEFFTQQIPHFLLCLIWIAMAMWLSDAIFPKGTFSKNARFAFYVSLLSLIAVLFIVTLTITIYLTVRPVSQTTGTPYTVITNCILYLIIVLSITIITIQLLRLSCTKTLARPLQKTMRILSLLSFVMWIVWILRFLYSLLRVLELNPFNDVFRDAISECVDYEDCTKHPILVISFQLIWEFVPTVLLLVMFHVIRYDQRTKRRLRKARKHKKRRKDDTITINDGDIQSDDPAQSLLFSAETLSYGVFSNSLQKLM
ncbi:hypothetical protein BLNAU_2671 [Blattamonas nauphoetae]|uniref:Uncharacterized protein n=1 Tax=Blattamonas nauphoetae TaxID=2049346 RepID=A0ABQ9YF82_9EUKA|nr:hypothetical protein BLNAU_2671 [Blattamonas nauphoetae]